jgi:ATP-dependent DNA ligase
VHIRGPVTPVRVVAIDAIPEELACSGGCRYEAKLDGFRAICRISDSGMVQLTSRRQANLSRAFPDIAAAVTSVLPPGTVVDGEIVRWGAEGRTDFAALQRRLVAGRRVPELARLEPCHYAIFDLLETGGTDYRPRPFAERRSALERLLADVPGTSPVILCPQTSQYGEARLWFEVLHAQGVEGIVVKAADDPYEPRVRWWKVKYRTSTEAVIGGVVGSLEAPQALILGRQVEGQLRVVGRTSPLPAVVRRQFAGVLTPAGGEHPWPEALPGGWAGGFPGADPVHYLRVIPNVVVEVLVDAAQGAGRWRHLAGFARLRTDLRPEDVPPGLEID